MRILDRAPVLLSVPLALLGVACAGESEEPKPDRTIATTVQIRPGGPAEEVEMPVFAAPVDPLRLPAEQVDLPASDLVLGVVAGGLPVAYPIRYLALSEVVDDRVGDLPVAPTW